jgi:hypothetical protein
MSQEEDRSECQSPRTKAKYEQEQLIKIRNEKQSAHVKLLIDKTFILCEAVVQDYIVTVSEKDHEFWGFTNKPSPFVHFKNPTNPDKSIKLRMGIVDSDHMFPINKCQSPAVRNEMAFMLQGLNVILQHVLNFHRVDNPDPNAMSKFETMFPQYFNKYSKFIIDPSNSTACLYCGEDQEFEEKHGRKPTHEEQIDSYRLSVHPKRIGFILGENSENSLGDDGHNPVTEEEISSIGSAMNACNIAVKPKEEIEESSAVVEES